jgi:hypothetical protein
VFGIRRPDGGFADIYLDGVKKNRVSFYAASNQRAKVYTSGPLDADTHMISIRPTGDGPASSSSAWVSIDTISVGTTLFEEGTLRQTFTRVDLSTASAGSYDRFTHVTDGDRAPAVNAKIVGTGVDIYAVKTPNSGKARIFVDGTLRATVDLKATTTQPNVLVFSMGFADGLHTVRIEAVGTATGKSSAIGFDRLVVH